MKEDTVFIFNLEVAHLPRHRDLRDTLTVTPALTRESYTEPATRNRYVRVLGEPGALTLHYAAEVDLYVHRADPATVKEVPVRAALDGLVRIGVGRDAPEAAFATAFGAITSERPRIWIERADGTGEAGERTTDAISTEEAVA